ncbi:MAG: metal-dependent transcriptional regulator [Treponema sp.]|nr:metal-dependent transcriptional regulator [Treponema sp.]MBQ2551319.1 metal-dependent transcriptional regulator [Treponema sp.]MBQ4236124.1 metal-dependent transcriptional regulator [Treponema sp.]MBQ5384775.1 metal-dependent transcriptional regulator [Treponema sp.]
MHESGEDYIEAILMLQKESGTAPRSVEVAKKLGVSKPSVSRAMGILVERGYLRINDNGTLQLTEKGEAKANDVYERHILLTQFLMKIAGVSEEQAARNACKIEHDIDEDIKNGIRRWMEKNS